MESQSNQKCVRVGVVVGERGEGGRGGRGREGGRERVREGALGKGSSSPYLESLCVCVCVCVCVCACVCACLTVS